MAFLIDTTGNPFKEVHPANGKAFTLDECYRLLKCSMIQVLNMEDGTLLVMDEEGKLGKVPPRDVNERATRLAHLHTGIAHDDYIVGDVLLCNRRELR